MCKYRRWMCLLTEQKCQKRFESRWKSDQLGSAEKKADETLHREWCALLGQDKVNLPMFTSSSVSASPMHSNWNSCRDWENFWTAAERSARWEGECVRTEHRANEPDTDDTWTRFYICIVDKKKHILLMQHSHKLTTYQDWQRDWRVVYPTPQKWQSWISKSTSL